MNRNTDFIPFALPCLGREEEEAVIRVMRSGWLTTGKETAAFEREFAEKVGSKHAIALNSATAGLHLSLETLDIQEDSWVLTTPYTFTAGTCNKNPSTSKVFKTLLKVDDNRITP